ncbi:DNA polymerase beta domain protein region (modular protein) [Candidatus Contendobacter odensis Run_B_J11]|uniref:DNA polymerase beta domain protein region (Modular protein) n=2 Tax=Candidatus Contendibacter odensensis TaxID=1400860 RepID=A0A7U7G7H7_9GAMM|nr:DNA polymerase beta domain protein region (modular protein) [Candidatus Contendobacter odensis Run_B_J11]
MTTLRGLAKVLPSFPRQRESSKPLKKLDTRFRGYDDFKGLGESPAFNSKDRGKLPMRLCPNEIEAIAQAAKEAFPPGTGIFLFGSRLDDQARGGDIDLLVEPPMAWSPRQVVDRRTRFIATLYRLLEEQRIDVLIAPADASDPRAIVDHARNHRVALVQI